MKNESKSPEIIAEGKHLNLVKQGSWEYATRPKITGIVGIIAVTDTGNLLLVEQYRPPLGKPVIELPAGLAGDIAGHESEELTEAARRELQEETGYEARSIECVAAGTSSAGITDEVIHLYLARGLTRTGEGGGDGSERITVHEVPVDQVDAWLSDRRLGGAMIDLKIYAALYFTGRNES